MATLQLLTSSSPSLLSHLSKITANNRTTTSHHQSRLIPRAAYRNRRQLIADTAAVTLSMSVAVPLLFEHRVAKADEQPLLAEWDRVYLPVDPGVVLLDIAFVPNDSSHEGSGK